MSISQQIPAESLLAQYFAQPTAELREQIVERYLSIAGIIARKFSGRGVDYDDLYQVASMALVKGLDRFDPGKGVKFASFITPTMVGEVKNYFRDRSRTIRLPRRGMALAAKLRSARAQLEQELGRSPTLDELVERTELDEAEVLEALELGDAAAPVSLDAQITPDDEDDAPLSRFLGMEERGFAEFERREALRQAMNALDERQRAVVQARYFENLSQRDIAARLNLSQMTVSRAERAALEILREQLASEPNQNGETK